MDGVNEVFAKPSGSFGNGSSGGRRENHSCFEQDHTAYGPQSSASCDGDTDGAYGHP